MSETSAPSLPPKRPFYVVLAYIIAALSVALGAGLGQGFVMSNLPQMAGDLGVTTTEASWLVVAYIVPRCCLPLMLVKLRSEIGLKLFTEIAVCAYVVFSFAGLWITDLRSAMVVEFLSGCAAAALTTIAFLYIMEPLSQGMKLVLGLPLCLTAMTVGPSLARVVSPSLLGDGGFQEIRILCLGLAMGSMALIMVLPLTPAPKMKVIEKLDFLSFSLISFGFTGLIISFVMGPIRWWSDAPWIGVLLAASIVALAAAVVIELWRSAPLIDIRWIVSPEMLHMSATLFLFRLLLSEQSAGAPRMFQVLGLAPSQMVGLFSVICLMSLVGFMACFAWMRPGRTGPLHLVALILIAVGAYMDSHATIDTRPHEMIISQGLIAVAGILFMAPAMMAGLLTALSRGPTYLLSFIIIFISTQSIGGMLGSGVFSSIINERQAFHMAHLQEQMTQTNAALVQEMTLRMGALSAYIPDIASQKAQALGQIATNVTMQSYVLAYNDAYFLTALVAVIAACLLVLHLLRDWLVLRFTPSAKAS